jgi:hypothetical protein
VNVNFVDDNYDSFARELQSRHENDKPVSKLTKIKTPTKIAQGNRNILADNTNKLVQDEFIKNLQQQLYFMELEIKLLKEKENERESLTGLELTDGQPLNENMIQFKAK